MQATPKSKARLFLVDDHALTRELLKSLLEFEPDFNVCGQSAQGLETLAEVCRAEPDLVILDLSSNGFAALELLEGLARLRPKLPVLVLSIHDERFSVRRVLKAGARGYITKDEAPTRIVAAVRRVLAGQMYLSPPLARRLDPEMTEQERCVS